MNRRGLFFPTHDENPRTIVPIVTWTLLALNVLVFFFTVFSLDEVISAYGFVPAEFSLITIFTSMFLHAGIAHIFGNAWFLFIFGDNVEEAFGHGKFLLFYLLCGVAATLTHWITNIGSVIPAVGASGAISGVLGAYLVLYPHAKVHVAGQFGSGKVPASVMLGVWFAYQLLSGFLGFFGSNSGVAFWAHIGGFVAGVLGAKLLARNKKNRSLLSS